MRQENKVSCKRVASDSATRGFLFGPAKLRLGYEILLVLVIGQRALIGYKILSIQVIGDVLNREM